MIEAPKFWFQKNLSSKIAYIKIGDANHDEFYKTLNLYTKVDNITYDSQRTLLNDMSGSSIIASTGLCALRKLFFRAFRFFLICISPIVYLLSIYA